MKTGNLTVLFVSLLVIITIPVSSKETVNHSIKENPDPVIGTNPISIDGDDDLESKASSNGWPGNGSQSNPFIIDGLTIDGQGGFYCLEIYSTRHHLKISNCTFFNSTMEDTGWGPGSGLHIKRSENILVENLRTHGNYAGILVELSEEISIVDSNISGDEVISLMARNGNGNLTLRSSEFGNSRVLLMISSWEKTSVNQCRFFSGKDIQAYSDHLSFEKCNFEDVNVSYSISAIDTLVINDSLFNRCRFNISKSGSRISNNSLVDTILTFQREGNYISNNTLASSAFRLDGYQAVFTNQTFNGNEINGKDLIHITDTDFSSVPYPVDYGQLILGNCRNMDLSGLSISDQPLFLQCGFCDNINVNSSLLTKGSSFEMVYCEDSSVHGNTITSDGSDSVLLKGCSDFNIRQNTVSGSGKAFHLENLVSSQICENIISSSGRAIRVTQSSRNLVINENLIRTCGSGMEIDGISNHINIYRNEILDSKGMGIHLKDACNNIKLHGNNISRSGLDGLNVHSCQIISGIENALYRNDRSAIFLNNSDQGTYYDNAMSDTGLLFRGSEYSYGNVFSPNNTLDLKPVYFYSKEDLSSTELPGEGGQLIFESCVNGKLNGFNSTGTFHPIQVDRSNHIELNHCNISDCKGPAISMFDCESMSVKEGLIESCFEGVVCENDPGIPFNQANFITDNVIIGSKTVGVRMLNGIGNKVIRNQIENSLGSNLILSGSNNCSVSSNLLTNSPTGVRFRDSQTVKFFDNAVHNCGEGFLAEGGTGYSNIYNNIFQDCSGPGIHLGPRCYMDRIFYNIFKDNNGTGDILDPDNLQVIDERGKARWNHPNGYGNYWSDLRSPDFDGDGVIDISYPVSDIASDDYPLVNTPFDHMSPPVDFSGRSGKGFVHLKWNEPLKNMDSGFNGYRIYRENDTGSRELIAEPGSDINEFNDTDLENDRIYLYYICGCNRFGDGGFAEPYVGKPDSLPPFIEILYPLNGEIMNTYHFEARWNCTDNSSRVRDLRIRLDDFSWVVLNISSKSHQFSQVSGGHHYLKLRAADEVGNMDTREISFIIDVDLPRIEITSPVSGSTLNGNAINFSWVGNDNTTEISGYQVRLDNGSWIDSGSRNHFLISDLEMGNHWLEVKAIDFAGNVQVEAVSVNIDSSIPQLDIIEPSNGSIFNRNELMIRWEAADTGPGQLETVLELDGESLPDQAGGSKIYLTDLEEGLHEMTIMVFDLAGNSVMSRIIFGIDTIAPVVTSREPEGSRVDLDSNISLTLSEPMDWATVMMLVDGSQVEFRRDGNVLTYDPPEDFQYGRKYSIGIVGRDLAGNELANGSWSFQTDNNASVRIKVTDSDGNPLSGVSVKLYSGEVFSTEPDGFVEFTIISGDIAVTFSVEGYMDKILTMNFLPGILNEPETVVMVEKEGGEEGNGNEDDHGSGGLIVVIIVILLFLALSAAGMFFFLKTRGSGKKKSGNRGSDPFDRAEEQRREAALREIDISAVEKDYRDAVYMKQIGDEEGAREKIDNYCAIMNEYLA
jgi:hypothetical protein